MLSRSKPDLLKIEQVPQPLDNYAEDLSIE
jgi:hypothetical protein